MTNEELATRIRDGERKLLPELWEGVRKYVSNKAYGYARRWARNDSPSTVKDLQEDLTQSAFLPLLNAAETFDADRDVLFLTYYHTHMRHAFYLAIAEYCGLSCNAFGRLVATKKRERKLAERGLRVKKPSPSFFADSLQAPAYRDNGDGDSIELCDTLPDGTNLEEECVERIFQKELHAQLERSLSVLSPEQQQAIRLRYYDDLPPSKIAERLSCKPARVKSNITAGLRMLRKNARFDGLDSFIYREKDVLRRIHFERLYGINFCEFISGIRSEEYQPSVGFSAFCNSGASSVERAVIHRERLQEIYGVGCQMRTPPQAEGAGGAEGYSDASSGVNSIHTIDSLECI